VPIAVDTRQAPTFAEHFMAAMGIVVGDRVEE